MGITADSLAKACAWAHENGAPLIVASTTGASAEGLMRYTENSAVRAYIVTHHPKRVSEADQFDPALVKSIHEAGYVLLHGRYSPLPLALVRFLDRNLGLKTWNRKHRILEETLGTGARVCFQITECVAREGYFKAGDTVVAAAGRRSGLDTVLALQVQSTKPLVLFLVKIIARDSRPDDEN